MNVENVRRRMRLLSIQCENVLMRWFRSRAYLKTTVGSPLPQTMRTQPTRKAYSLGCFFFCEETFLEQGGGAVNGYKTVPFNWHDRMKSGLLWDVTCGEKMLRTSGSQEVFRGWQLLHKWQINGTSCLELGTDWKKKSSYLLQALGLLRGTPGTLMLAVCLWSRSSLRKKETLPVFFPASRLSCVCLDNRK